MGLQPDPPLVSYGGLGARHLILQHSLTLGGRSVGIADQPACTFIKQVVPQQILCTQEGESFSPPRHRGVINNCPDTQGSFHL